RLAALAADAEPLPMGTFTMTFCNIQEAPRHGGKSKTSKHQNIKTFGFKCWMFRCFAFLVFCFPPLCLGDSVVNLFFFSASSA
ncbi:MAG: hypothetical protein ACYC26_14410, partial [Phycisphaerales bacterium]